VPRRLTSVLQQTQRFVYLDGEEIQRPVQPRRDDSGEENKRRINAHVRLTLANKKTIKKNNVYDLAGFKINKRTRQNVLKRQ